VPTPYQGTLGSNRLVVQSTLYLSRPKSPRFYPVLLLWPHQMPHAHRASLAYDSSRRNMPSAEKERKKKVQEWATPRPGVAPSPKVIGKNTPSPPTPPRPSIFPAGRDDWISRYFALDWVAVNHLTISLLPALLPHHLARYPGSFV
jgi:hypothetical protein